MAFPKGIKSRNSGSEFFVPVSKQTQNKKEANTKNGGIKKSGKKKQEKKEQTGEERKTTEKQKHTDETSLGFKDPGLMEGV